MSVAPGKSPGPAGSAAVALSGVTTGASAWPPIDWHKESVSHIGSDATFELLLFASTEAAFFGIMVDACWWV